MVGLFSDQERLWRWTEIEILAAGALDSGVERYLREALTPPTPEEVAEREKTTDHDVAAFVDLLQRQVPAPIGKHIHNGLTSSDIVDTALCWTLRDALDEVILWGDQEWQQTRRLVRARRGIAVGKLSGAVGTYSNVDPKVEAYVCGKLGLKPVPATQVISRDRHAEVVFAVAMVRPQHRRWVTVAIENVALWHERDISHSAAERLMFADIFAD